MSDAPIPSQQGVPPELLSSLSRTYADLLRRQRTAASPLVSWLKTTSRSHEFTWLGGHERVEQLLGKGGSLRIRPSSIILPSVARMFATTQLNPYEREILYGYPYVIGRRAGKTIRAPLLTAPVSLEPGGGGFLVALTDDVVRFNSLPFRATDEAPFHEQAVARLIEATPALPLTPESLRSFVEALHRELPEVRVEAARLDGSLDDPPVEPNSGDWLSVIDQAALFIAPKTNYFLTSDLEAMAEAGSTDCGSLASLLTHAGDEAPTEFSDVQLDSTPIYYPFPSNRSQRRAALLVDDPNTRVIRVEGPPGTGKSLTIANLACHLAATGRTVLITSQKDKALQVVDEMLCRLGLAELPMTLLRQDRESKKNLLSRLERIKKERSLAEVEQDYSVVRAGFGAAVGGYRALVDPYQRAVKAENLLERSHRHLQTASRLRRLARSASFRVTAVRAVRMARQSTDVLSHEAAHLREALRSAAREVLELGCEHRIARASRGERQQLNELSAVLRRDQRTYRNYSLFDAFKSHPDRAERLLTLLPVWLLTPDDAARLFPMKPGLFDLVIVDEASQVDLPSIAPVLFRGKKAAVFGDTKQMQPRRFAFMTYQVAYQAWQQYGMERLDPEEWLDPIKQSLLTLAAVRAQEENLLDEHFRSLPPIIEFSNSHWYGGRLRVMTDERRKRFGGPEQPIIQMHYVPDGEISNGSQENEREAAAVVELLGMLVTDPDYANASIGVICLFEEQVALIQDLIAEAIPPKEWEEHSLVVVNPDGFQGDERDVVLYSLSWDDKIMPRQALSQRQRDHPHEQGMLNVAFTRPRDEVHVFHSAPIDTFTMADGAPGSLTEWLRHAARVEKLPRIRPSRSRLGQSDSQFEAEVACALEERGIGVLHQYPACGFSIDLVCELDGRRVAVECDGWTHHADAHGRLKIEDLERQAVLERAGWRVVRIPYRRWLKDPLSQVMTVLDALGRLPEPLMGPQPPHSPFEVGGQSGASKHQVTREGKAILKALGEGNQEEEALLRRTRELLGYKRLGRNIRRDLLATAQALNHGGFIASEDGEWFFTARGRATTFTVARPSVRKTVGGGKTKTTSARTPAARAGCSCGGRWVLRRGRYGKFYGCSRYPRCHRTRPY